MPITPLYWWTESVPADHIYVNITAGNWPPVRNNIYYDDDVVTFALLGGSLVGSTYEVRDYYGDVIDSGPAANPLVIDNPGAGWYRLYIKRAVSHATWKFSQGSASFMVWRRDERFPDLPDTPDVEPTNNYSGGEVPMTCTLMAHVERLSVNDATAPEAGGASGTLSTALIDAAIMAERYVAYDPPRSKAVFVGFPYYDNTGPQNAGVTDCVEALAGDVSYFEPTNEPNAQGGAAWMPKQEAFYAAVKAGDPTAKVLGPCPVSVGGEPDEPNNGYKFMADCLALGLADAIDALSFHDYNGVNGDLALGRLVHDRFRNLRREHAVDDLELWMTEWGNFGAHAGVLQPRHQARWVMMGLELYEQYGIPKERVSYFYPVSHGFNDYPSWLGQYQNRAHLPATHMMRVRSEELFGKTFAKRYSFGNPGDVHHIGSRFDGEDGSVATFMASGRTDATVTMWVKGASILTVVSALGVESTVSVVDGQATVDIENGIPTYVRLPVDVTINPIAPKFGPDLLRGWTATASGSGDGTEFITDGVAKTWYFLITGGQANTAVSPFLDDTNAEGEADPSWVQLDGSATTLDTVIVECPPPWQVQGTLLDFDLQRWDGSSWVTLGTVNEPLREFEWFAYFTDNQCRRESYFSDRCVFEFTFAPVSVSRLRIYCRAATYGGSPSLASRHAGGQGLDAPNICLRRVMGFHRAGLSAPKYGARVAA